MDFSQLEGYGRVSPKGVPVVPGAVSHIDGDMLAYQCGGNERHRCGHIRRILRARSTC